jgi:general secretion pathway protein D
MLSLLVALPLAFPLQDRPGAQTGPPPIQEVGDDYVLNFDETGGVEGLTLEAFVKICQQATDLNFTYTEDTAQVLRKKTLRMFGPKTIPKRDFFSFFQIMMVIHQCVTIKVGPPHLSVVLVISLETQERNFVRRSAVYVTPEELDDYEDQPATLVTTVMHLPNTDVRTLSNSMRTMLTDANTQQIIPVGNSNSLILTGFGSDVVALARMLEIVDDASAADTTIVPAFEVLPLEFAAAEEIASTIEELLDASRQATQQRAQVQQAQGVSGQLQTGATEAKIMVDPRTNSLLVMAMPDDMPRIKQLVAQLDVDVVERERSYHIYALENVSAEDLSEVLEDFLRDASRIDTRPGAAARQAAAAQGGGATTSTSRNEFVVVPDPVTNSLLIAANRTRYEEVLDLIRRLDKRQDQVLIETALIELSGNDLLDIGVELGFASLGADGDGSFGVSSFGFSTFQDTDSPPDGIPDVRIPGQMQGLTAGIISGGDFSLPILVSALSRRQDTNVLNVPSVLVNNNGHAVVVSKDEQPTTTITLGTGGSAATQENFNEYVEAGITLEISPSISASNYLRLGVSLEVSTFSGAVSGSIPPPRATRTIETTVNVPDGDTMVIGGIITDNTGTTQTGVPFLMDIPLLGRLFQRKAESGNRTTLYFFVTPHIMSDVQFADLAEISYRKKLEAADAIGAGRIRVIDPNFQREREGVDLRGFELPLHRSPPRGEIDEQDAGLDPERINELLREEGRAPETQQPDPDGDQP